MHKTINKTDTPQVHFNNTNQYVSSTWDAEKEEVVMCVSLALPTTWQLKLQLSQIYGKTEDEDTVRKSEKTTIGSMAPSFAAHLQQKIFPMETNPADTSLVQGCVNR